MENVLSAIMGQPWVIIPEALDSIIQIVEKNLETKIDPKVFHGAEKAILPRDGLPIEGTQRATLHDSIAVLPLVGPIFPRANLMTNYSGAVDIQGFTNDYKLLLGQDKVKGIIINVDSPGGYIVGIVEASDYIFKTRGQKPVVSYVYGHSASAALWISSSTDEIIMSETAFAGSIGAVIAYRSTKGKDEKAGIKNYEIISNQSPKKRIDFETNEGKAEVQKMVDDLAGIFIGKVARNRDTTNENVINNFGGGGMLVAQKAVDVGLADRVGNLTGLIDGMNKEYGSNSQIYVTSNKGELMELTLETLKKDHTAIYEAVRSAAKKEGFTEGVASENKRIQDIEKITIPGSKSVIDKLKFDTNANVGSISKAIIDSQSEKLKTANALIKKDGEKTAEKVENVDSETDDKGATTDAERKVYQDNLKRGASRA